MRTRCGRSGLVPERREGGPRGIPLAEWQFHLTANVVESFLDGGPYGDIFLTDVQTVLPGGALSKDDICFVHGRSASDL